MYFSYLIGPPPPPLCRLARPAGWRFEYMFIFTGHSKCIRLQYVKSMSWCRRRGAHNWIGGTIGEREREWGGKGEGGGQYTSNLGPEWTGIAPHAKEGFQVSKRDSGTGEGSSRQRGIIKGIARGYQRDCAMCLQHNINLIHIVLIVCMLC
jgi:hypothetical protein